jgi:hypothetical protein
MSVMPDAQDLLLPTGRAMMVAKLVGGLVVIALIGFVIWKLFFADIQRRVAEERGGRVVAEEQAQGAKETGIEAGKTVVRTYERHTMVDRIVKEGQSNVNEAYAGGEVEPAVDAAGAAALCGLHVDLCRNKE